MTDNVIGIIPARGGSKGVPDKNKRLVGGAPLIRYTLDAVLAARSLSRIVVSTDDEDIADIARASGVDATLRPAELATDTSPVLEAVKHVLDNEARNAFTADAVVLLQPTSPFRSGEDIDAAVELFFRSGRVPVCSVYQCDDNHPARMYRVEAGRLSSLMPELSSLRRQDLPPVYHRNGSIYVFGQREIAGGAIIVDHMMPYVMPQQSSINVDSELELLLVNALLEQRRENSTS